MPSLDSVENINNNLTKFTKVKGIINGNDEHQSENSDNETDESTVKHDSNHNQSD